MFLKGGECLLNKKESYQLRFYFPTVARGIEQIQQVRIEPLWEQVSATHVVGLFRITVQLTFKQKGLSSLQRDNAIAIEQIDLQGGVGYFEYAWPFEWHFKEDIEQFLINVRHVDVVILHDQVCHIQWRAEASWRNESSSGGNVRVENPRVDGVKEAKRLPVSQGEQKSNELKAAPISPQLEAKPNNPQLKVPKTPQVEAELKSPQLEAKPKNHQLKAAPKSPQLEAQSNNPQLIIPKSPPQEAKSKNLQFKAEPKSSKLKAEQKSNKPVADSKPVKKDSFIFMNDLVEQYSIWRSNDLPPKQDRYNDKK